MKQLLTVQVNGRSRTGIAEPRTTLVDFLRDSLDLTATHVGCEHGVCGACTIMLDGKPVRSCTVLAMTVADAKIETADGFVADPIMDRLRAAFSAHHALQCGFCTPGMLMTAYDLVRRLKTTDEARIRRELAGNLCRCTGYAGIVAAIRSVIAETMEPGDRRNGEYI